MDFSWGGGEKFGAGRICLGWKELLGIFSWKFSDFFLIFLDFFLNVYGFPENFQIFSWKFTDFLIFLLDFRKRINGQGSPLRGSQVVSANLALKKAWKTKSRRPAGSPAKRQYLNIGDYFLYFCECPDAQLHIESVNFSPLQIFACKAAIFHSRYSFPYFHFT